ncbi:Amidohydrolase 3 [Candidatus Zixiibacteriota bacterium]|nr:Amidohydrolase 3 [candidate division Zixibacteria bacterium]
MTRNNLFYNGKIYTQAEGLPPVADSMAVSNHTIIAVGHHLEKDPDFKFYRKFDLRGKTVIPGLVDSHTHFYFMAISLGNVHLDGAKSIADVLNRIRRHVRTLSKNEWVIGEGFSPDQWDKYLMPDRCMLDKVTGGRPAAIFSKDTHMMWANSAALALGGIARNSPDPSGGTIVRFDDGEPTGILKEIPAYFPVFKKIKRPPRAKAEQLYRRALEIIYSRGVTAVHSFDGPDALPFFTEKAAKGALGLRINYYPPAKVLPELKIAGVKGPFGNDYLQISGVKIFADGALGSQTALCFDKYDGSQNNFGIEVTPKKEMLRLIKSADSIGLPCAIHAIGDKAICNVLDCVSRAPRLKNGARHRIEHLQMIRPSDVDRVKRLGIIASMQPTHCPSDVHLIRKYWKKRAKNCYIFNTFLKKNIPLAFGSDAPIEPLDPLAGIDAAVNRFIPGTKKSFNPKEKISVSQAIHGFTAGAAYAVNKEYECGYLLPGYKADFVILSEDIYHVPPAQIGRIKPLATIFDGRLVYKSPKISLSF